MSPIYLALMFIPVFILVFTCTMYALERTGLREARCVLALAVSALCALGLLRGGAEQESLIDAVLIPYEALAYSLILLAILWLLSRASLWVHKVRANWRRQAEKERIECRHCMRANEEERRPARIALECEKHEETNHASPPEGLRRTVIASVFGGMAVIAVLLLLAILFK